MISKSELLAAVINRLLNPDNWTKRTSARDRYGRSAFPWAADARQWCVTGAIDAELRSHGLRSDCMGLMRELTATFVEQHPEMEIGGGIAAYNDHPCMTHSGMMAVLEKTHAKLVERGE